MKTFIANILAILYVIAFFTSVICTLAIILTLQERTLEFWSVISPIAFVMLLAGIGPSERYFKKNAKF